MSQVSTVQDNFKVVYGKLNEVLISDFQFQKDIPFQDSAKVGESYIEAFPMTFECGITFAGSGLDAYDINPAVAGTVKQSNITPSQTVLTSVIPWAVMSRSNGGGVKAFFDATKHILQNHIKSHNKFLEIARIYGQSVAGLGTLNYDTGVYKGVSLTAGAGTYTLSNGETLQFLTGGIATTMNTSAPAGAQGAILFAKGQFAPQIWSGMEGVRINEIATAAPTVIVKSGKVLGVDTDIGFIYVDFVPTAASAASSHKISFEGWEDSKEMVGIQKILSNAGTLFGINASQYSLWKSSTLNLGSKRFNLKAVQKGVAQAMNRGGLDKGLTIYVSPNTFANMTADDAALRSMDATYSKANSETGSESITYYAANGKNIIKPNAMIKDGEAFGLCLEDWFRSGSTEITNSIPGLDQQLIFPLENQTGWCFRSFSDQYIISRRPANQIYFYGIDNESVAYA